MRNVILALVALFGLTVSAPAVSAQTPDAAIEGYNAYRGPNSGQDHTVYWWLHFWIYDPVGYDVYNITVTITDFDGTSHTVLIEDGPFWQQSNPDSQTDWYTSSGWYDYTNTAEGGYYYDSSATPDVMDFDMTLGWTLTRFVSDMTVQFGNLYWDDDYGVWMVDVQYTAHPYYYNSSTDNVRYSLYSSNP